VDPWHDYLALPIAPLVLLAQIGALFLPSRHWRWALAAACPLGILAMWLYVASLPEKPGEGVNIGAGVLVLWLIVSVVIFLVGLVAEAVRLARAPRFADENEARRGAP
jgi:4-amino-4-deoxy-L-arabinose transferase-like glycosyltransferase